MIQKYNTCGFTAIRASIIQTNSKFLKAISLLVKYIAARIEEVINKLH
jgi:hypothetical protein